MGFQESAINASHRTSHSSGDSLLRIAIGDFGRSPGSTRLFRQTIAAPGHLGVAMIGVREGSAVDLVLSLEVVHEGIFVSGSVYVRVEGECSRCLDPFEHDLDVDVQEMFFFEEPERVRGRENAEDDDEQRLIEHDAIDLEPTLRDAVVTALPFQPVCREDCAGLCSECGARLADHPGHHHETLDPRWEALRPFSEKPKK